jgi:hypothetical protein
LEDIDNVYGGNIVTIENLGRHYQLGGSLREYVDFSFYFIFIFSNFTTMNRAINEPSLGEPGLSKLAYLKISQAHAELQNLSLARLIVENSL